MRKDILRYDKDIQETDGPFGQAAEEKNGAACLSHVNRGDIGDARRFDDPAGHERCAGGRRYRQTLVSAGDMRYFSCG